MKWQLPCGCSLDTDALDAAWARTGPLVKPSTEGLEYCQAHQGKKVVLSCGCWIDPPALDAEFISFDGKNLTVNTTPKGYRLCGDHEQKKEEA